MLPRCAIQVTDLLLAVPWTAAENCNVPSVVADGEAGEIDTELTPEADDALTVTMAEADLVVSATLVAVTVAVPAADGAVYTPAEVIVPDVAAQVTAEFVVVPCTVAANGMLPLGVAVAEAGLMLTEVTPVPGGGVEPDDVAVALSCTTTGLALALVMIERLPTAVPGVVAAKATAKLWLAPGAMLAGNAKPLVLKPAPDTAI